MKIFARAETFGEDISDLVFAGNKTDLNVTPNNFFMEKKEINSDMFSTSILNRIGCYICGRQVVTEYLYRKSS